MVCKKHCQVLTETFIFVSDAQRFSKIHYECAIILLIFLEWCRSIRDSWYVVIVIQYNIQLKNMYKNFPSVLLRYSL